ncbi:MAG: hypothetical protein JWM53_38 [bacterium]|nr:hypothetical protein [bacterium]
MAAEKAELKSKSVPSDREGIVSSFVTQTAELAERATGTTFGIVRDVRGEISQRILGAIAFIDGSQQGFIKLLRGINDRADKLSDDLIDTIENLSVGTLRTVRDTSRGVTDLATNLTTNLTKPREIRAA